MKRALKILFMPFLALIGLMFLGFSSLCAANDAVNDLNEAKIQGKEK